MALTHGMDVAQVRSSMAKIKNYADQLDNLKSVINTEMTKLRSVWSGQDAIKFADTDWRPYRDNMGSLAAALRSLSDAGLRQANDQENVSRA